MSKLFLSLFMMVALCASATEKKAMPTTPLTPRIESLDIYDDIEHPGDIVIKVTACGGKILLFKGPATELTVNQDAVMQMIVDTVTKMCSHEARL